MLLQKSTVIRLAAAAFAFASLSAACGGGDDNKNEDSAAPTEATAIIPQSSPTRASPTRIPATAVPSTGPAIAVGGSGKAPYVPTVDEFRALPKVTVKGQSGVTLAALAEKAGLSAAVTATIDGVAKGANNEGAIRYPVKDIASTTIFVISDSGHISIVSDVIPEAEWLTFVTSITLQ